jgi:hypothetical protein
MNAEVGGGNQRRSKHEPIENAKKKTSNKLIVFRSFTKNKWLGLRLNSLDIFAKLMN